MPGGRPTQDPKATLVAVRLAARQRVLLERRMKRETIGLSEALRRCLDEWAASAKTTTRRSVRDRAQMTPEERESFDQVFAALGARRARARRRH